jgi:hypothetical protein
VIAKGFEFPGAEHGWFQIDLEANNRSSWYARQNPGLEKQRTPLPYQLPGQVVAQCRLLNFDQINLARLIYPELEDGATHSVIWQADTVEIKESQWLRAIVEVAGMKKCSVSPPCARVAGLWTGCRGRRDIRVWS